jgi:ssDNA-specific exonuclease RecJ
MSLAVHELYKKNSFAYHYSLQQLVDQKEEEKNTLNFLISSFF